MENNKNIWLLPTNEPSRLVQKRITNEIKLSSLNNPQLWNNVNIYITNNEIIKEGDYIFYSINKVVGKVLELGRRTSNGESIPVVYCKETGSIDTEDCKKIILNTNPKLIKDSVQAIPDDFLEWFVNNSSCDFVEVEEHEIDTWDLTVNGYKIIIPKVSKPTAMENKTPIQEAIDKIKEISNNENTTGFSKRAYSVCLDVLESLLEKEQDYYNQKFKS
jgi:hypothetical protein